MVWDQLTMPVLDEKDPHFIGEPTKLEMPPFKPILLQGCKNRKLAASPRKASFSQAFDFAIHALQFNLLNGVIHKGKNMTSHQNS
jgi:hypothetical protein